MKYLNFYTDSEFNEGFDIDKFHEFIKKYNKTDYISKGSGKKLKEIGMEESDFLRMKNEVNKCVEFLKKVDTDTIQELMDYVRDDVPEFIDKIEISLEIVLGPKQGYDSINMNSIMIPKNPSDLDSEDKKLIFNDILQKVYN